MSLLLKKPLMFFDLETTGVDVDKDKIVEIAIVKLMPDGIITEKSRRINPLIPIPAGATEVHKITDEDVKDCPAFGRIAKALFKEFEGCDIGGYNSDRFDVPLLSNEFARCGIEFPPADAVLIDVYQNEGRLNPRDLATIYNKYTSNKLDGAHEALADTRATCDIFIMQSEADPKDTTPEEIEALILKNKKRFDFAGRFYYDEEGKVRFGFGKYKDEIVKDKLQDAGYFDWIKKNQPSETVRKLSAFIAAIEEANNNFPPPIN